MPRRSARRSTSTERWAAGGLAAILCLIGAKAHAGADSGPDRRAVAELARQVDAMEKEVELSSGSEFYVLLDPVRSKLVLKLRGAALREYPIEAVQVGAPRVAFRNRHLADDWQGRIWTHGTLLPGRERERTEIIPPDSTRGDSLHVMKPPPLPEDLYPVPVRYHVRYEGGLSIEVRPHELDSSVDLLGRISTALHVWCRDLCAALTPSPEDVVRLRIVMKPEHAASFYRALPPATRLLVVPRS